MGTFSPFLMTDSVGSYPYKYNYYAHTWARSTTYALRQAGPVSMNSMNASSRKHLKRVSFLEKEFTQEMMMEVYNWKWK